MHVSAAVAYFDSNICKSEYMGIVRKLSYYSQPVDR